MSKRARTLILGVALAAMNLAGTTAIAQAHTSDPTSTRHRALGQLKMIVQDAVAAQEQPADTIARFRRGWLVLGLGVLAVVLALSGGLAGMVLRRTRGRVRVRQVAACMCLWWHLMGRCGRYTSGDDLERARIRSGHG
jgi:hypothetical protein